MAIKKLTDKYVREVCSKCTNRCKEINICNITIKEDDKERVAKCENFSNEVQK